VEWLSTTSDEKKRKLRFEDEDAIEGMAPPVSKRKRTQQRDIRIFLDTGRPVEELMMGAKKKIPVVDTVSGRLEDNTEVGSRPVEGKVTQNDRPVEG
jgi:hypothetical protein